MIVEFVHGVGNLLLGNSGEVAVIVGGDGMDVKHERGEKRNDGAGEICGLFWVACGLTSAPLCVRPITVSSFQSPRRLRRATIAGRCLSETRPGIRPR